MPKYQPKSRVLFDPKERPPTKKEESILEFLERGLAYTVKQTEVAKRDNKFGSCHDLQIQAMTLKNIIDGLRAGYHDPKHPKRIIDPQERAEYLFNLIPMS